MNKKENVAEVAIKRIGGYLHRVVPIVDEAGNVISHALKPFMVEFRLRDIMQVIVGASLLAVPVAFTEEVWKLSAELPLRNVLSLSGLSLLFIGLFVYFNFYRSYLGKHWFQYCKRVFLTYAISLLVVALLLWIIQRCPWETEPIVALKRVLIVAFPASMSAAVSDVLK
jgi:uncharacterized membrane protein